ncbi:hypothetical protein BGW39_001956 [Mortierella sp. 14UC]|nr:hypothetical protein BGW39_001956 [Mortierella sp. 14UC]
MLGVRSAHGDQCNDSPLFQQSPQAGNHHLGNSDSEPYDDLDDHDYYQSEDSCDDYYYDDFSLAPPSASQDKAFRHLLDSSTLPELPLEILERVCTHFRVWKSVDGAQGLPFQQWPGLNTLEVWFDQDPDVPKHPISGSNDTTPWEVLVTTIRDSTAAGQDSQQDNTDKTKDNNNNNDTPNSTLALCLIHTIRHLKLRGH